MYWRITEDKISDGTESFPSRVGTGNGDEPVGPTFTAKLYDDDGEHYYTVAFDRESYEASDDLNASLYGALRYAEYDAGATDLRVSLASLRKLHGEESSTFAIFRDKIARPDGWCSIFG